MTYEAKIKDVPEAAKREGFDSGVIKEHESEIRNMVL